jgi:hypothetical protein
VRSAFDGCLIWRVAFPDEVVHGMRLCLCGWVIDSCMLWLMIKAPVTGVLAAARVVKHSQSRWTMFGWLGCWSSSRSLDFHREQGCA